MGDHEILAAAHRRAREAVDIAYADPSRSVRIARGVRAIAGIDSETSSLVEQALGIARTAKGDLAAAEAHLRVAIELDDGGGPAAEARGFLAFVLLLTGRSVEALAEADRAAPGLSGRPAAALAMRRGLVLSVLGRGEEAQLGYTEALTLLAAAGGDHLLEADIRNNRAVVHIAARDWPAAAEELDRAEGLYLSAGQTGNSAVVHHNRGLAAALQGDVPAALSAFDEAAERYAAAGIDPGLLPVERAEALLSVLLLPDARRAAEEAIAAYTRQRYVVHLPEAHLALARAALLGGDLATTGREAAQARRVAGRQQRPAWRALADYMGLRARYAGGERTPGLMRAGRRVATVLASTGWVVEALDARLVVARVALDLDRPAVARRELAQATGGVDDGPAELRARTWHAHALLRLADGDPAGAEAALDAGMAVLERFRESLGATELRVHAAGHAGELAGLGLRLAMARGGAEDVLLWAERWRAGALLVRPARPTDDARMTAHLAELRQVTAALAAPDGPGAQALRTRQALLEESVRRCAHRAGRRGLAGERLRSVAELDLTARETTLVEYVAVDGELHAIVATGGRARMHGLGPVVVAETDIDALRYGLRRLAYRIGATGSHAAAAGLIEHRAGRLDALLLAPLLADVGPGPLVVVPTGALHALPWAALPSCAGRAVSVAPSAALWRRAADSADAAPSSSSCVFAAGPDLPHAAAEVVALAGRYRSARRFTGRNATVEAVVRALDGAERVHIAAHGLFRADNPLFSSLRLADGPLTVYDLERLSRPPRHVIFSACESGLPAVHPGDELLGLAAALLGMGTTSLIATVVPVPDDAGRTVMLRLHRHLRVGHPPAAALALAQRPQPGESPAARAAALGFLCYGAG